MNTEVSYTVDWQAIGVIVPSVIATVSLLWAIYQSRKTEKLNSIMIEESTRPIIAIYTDYIDTGSLVLYLVIRNFGKSVARIDNIVENESLLSLNAYKATNERDLIKDLIGSILAPNQSKIIALKYESLIEKTINFDVNYSSSTKSYNVKFEINLTAGIHSPKIKSATTNKELKSISYTLQEMLQRNLWILVYNLRNKLILVTIILC